VKGISAFYMKYCWVLWYPFVVGLEWGGSFSLIFSGRWWVRRDLHEGKESGLHEGPDGASGGEKCHVVELMVNVHATCSFHVMPFVCEYVTGRFLELMGFVRTLLWAQKVYLLVHGGRGKGQ
jgi:hypothetical protein